MWGWREMDVYIDCEYSDVYFFIVWGDIDGNYEGKVEVMMYL